MKNYAKMTDAQLIKEFQLGDDRAFNELVRRHHARLKKIVLDILNNNQFDADDVLSKLWKDVFTMFRNGKYKETGRFPHLVSRMAKNSANDVHRNRKKQLTDYEPDIESREITDSISDEDSLLEEERIKKARIAKIYQRLSKLSVKMRTIVKMRIEQDLSFGEIAQKIGEPENQVRVYHSRAMQRLRA